MDTEFRKAMAEREAHSNRMISRIIPCMYLCTGTGMSLLPLLKTNPSWADWLWPATYFILAGLFFWFGRKIVRRRTAERAAHRLKGMPL